MPAISAGSFPPKVPRLPAALAAKQSAAPMPAPTTKARGRTRRVVNGVRGCQNRSARTSNQVCKACSAALIHLPPARSQQHRRFRLAWEWLWLALGREGYLGQTCRGRRAARTIRQALVTGMLSWRVRRARRPWILRLCNAPAKLRPSTKPKLLQWILHDRRHLRLASVQR